MRGGTTSTLRRHMSSSKALSWKRPKQSTLSFPPADGSGIEFGGFAITSYDQMKIREIIAKMIIVHEYPFKMVEYTWFNILYKSLNPSYEKMSRNTIKLECMKVYETEKEKLKKNFKGAEWGIQDNVQSITLNKARNNDVAADQLKINFQSRNKLHYKGKIFHIRCCAHILNLMVQDGLKEIDSIIQKIRESVKYLKKSSSRLFKFGEIARQLDVPTSKGLRIDVPTRWNSTYLMLDHAFTYKHVFSQYAARDANYKWLLTPLDWGNAEKICKFLGELTTYLLFDDEYMVQMAKIMGENFNKYWGDCNLFMAISSILDPRYKMKLIEFCSPKIYSVFDYETYIKMVRDSLYELYDIYVVKYERQSTVEQNSQSFQSLQTIDEFEEFCQSTETVRSSKSEMDTYLEEIRFKCDKTFFDGLEWWKMNTLKFPTLSRMARDILTIPITTVASESVFSAGGRVLDQYRSSLAPKTVDALICSGSWLRATQKAISPPSCDYVEEEDTRIVIPDGNHSFLWNMVFFWVICGGFSLNAHATFYGVGDASGIVGGGAFGYGLWEPLKIVWIVLLNILRPSCGVLCSIVSIEVLIYVAASMLLDVHRSCLLICETNSRIETSIFKPLVLENGGSVTTVLEHVEPDFGNSIASFLPSIEFRQRNVDVSVSDESMKEEI
ncbi:zinc finger BED domain-containing protein RICESLEEPER 2-like [Tasmannia lanceolata]|uniref:zinc finger BED domain-containing protein RICESLEEPER 2-like n=1 Tax=Tasmannia lanceolata TaxID=3420 RepID=UPI004063CDB4